MKRIAMIPARGGSKRLPRKNVADFMGKPIIAWTINAAKETGLFDRIIVSTDDSEIADISKQFGAAIETRDPKLATDGASSLDVCLDFAARHKDFDVFCCLYATSPLRTAADIKSVVELIKPGMCDFAVAMTHFDLPVHQSMWRKKDGSLRAVMPDMIKMQSQDVPEIVVDNGSTYAVSIPAFLREQTFFGSTLKSYAMPRSRSQDIDEAIDLEIARFFAGKFK
jgi:pseudaminic acid cytidylyltransferase